MNEKRVCQISYKALASIFRVKILTKKTALEKGVKPNANEDCRSR